MMRNDSPHDPEPGGRTLAIVSDGHGFEARVQTTPDGGDGIVVAVSGEVDMATADMLWQAVEDACGRAGRVIVDLVGTSYLDSSGLAVLVRAYDRLDQRPGAVVVRSPTPGVRQVLTISGLDHVLTVTPDQA